MIDPIIQANSAKQAVLEAAKAAFFLSGGKVEGVPIGASAGYKIRSPDHAGRAKGREKVLSAQRRKGLESAEKLRVCAANGLTRDECAKELGWTPDRVRSTARIHGIEVRTIKPNAENMRKAKAAQSAGQKAKRAAIAALITPLAAKGALIADMAVAANCSRATVMRVIEQFGIVRGKKMDIAS
jgi:hypothetical protein